MGSIPANQFLSPFEIEKQKQIQNLKYIYTLFFSVFSDELMLLLILDILTLEFLQD